MDPTTDTTSMDAMARPTTRLASRDSTDGPRALSAADEVRHESALLYPQFSWEELGGRFLGLMAYLRFERILGDQSMPGKQRPRSGVRAGALRDPRNTVRAGLPEAKSPAMQAAIHRKDV